MYVMWQGTRVYYREYMPPPPVESSGQSVLLLHGRSFSSLTWAKLGTPMLLAAIGHHVVAVDLPGMSGPPLALGPQYLIPSDVAGFGNTGGSQYKDSRANFLHALIQDMNLERPLLVAPSMSGSYALPFLAAHPDKLSGFVPVAPTSTNIIPQEKLRSIKV